MWSIARIDYEKGRTESPSLNACGLFGLVWAHRMRDLPSFAEIRQESGFVGPADDLIILRPDGTVKAIDEA